MIFIDTRIYFTKSEREKMYLQAIMMLGLFFAFAGPYFILTNNPQTNVFRYPAIVAFQGSGKLTLQSGCTLTSCWTQPEDAVSWLKGSAGDDIIAREFSNYYDEGKIDHNTYTAPSCVSRNIANIPSDANFCEICGDMRPWNFQGALWMCYSYFILVPLGAWIIIEGFTIHM